MQKKWTWPKNKSDLQNCKVALFAMTRLSDSRRDFAYPTLKLNMMPEGQNYCKKCTQLKLKTNKTGLSINTYLLMQWLSLGQAQLAQ